MDLLFVKRHNVCAVLNTTDPKNADFLPVLDFLANSSISFAISHNLPVFETTKRQFWSTATTTVINNVEHIRATVHNQEVLFSEATIREVRHFNDNHEAPVDFPSYYVKECFRRLGHPNEFKGGHIIKNALPPLWRYIVHVFIHCTSIRKGGFDSANVMVASAVLGLIKGRDYNFYGLVFGQLKENLTGGVKEKFLVYPRFLQIIINHLHPNLQQDVDSSSEEEEADHDQGNHEPDVIADQQIQQDAEQPILEAPFMDQMLENIEPVIEEQLDENIDADVNIEVQENIEAEADSKPLAKKIKTGLESLTSSGESLFNIPEHLTLTHSPTHIPPPSPQPSPPHTPVTTPPASPILDPSPYVPRVKTLSLEVKRLQEAVTKRDEEIEKLNTELRESKEDVIDLRLEVGGLHTQLDETPSTAQGENTSTGGPSSPANPQSALTIFTGQATKTKDVVEVKLEETSYDLPSVSERRAARERGKGNESSAEVVILDEEEIGSDHELNALLEEIDNYGFNEDYPEILAT
ncbi:hypothetical protein L1987_01038 [Smallanthus sonchifolius]|uniref:Uncharacterized protein n=1 Tax=Smallanthus sonchifolius TaxID=185202 RepID=A0ACB9K3Z5_9ASTR|nr:hypothetical protein L1987_01038 [Smallanthus sonchifolius]